MPAKRLALRPKKSGGAKAKALPKAPHAAIKRAKRALQKWHLNMEASKADALKEEAELEIANADANCGDRKYWRQEILINSNHLFSESVGNSSWYCKTFRVVQWSFTKMPDWAQNGEDEPNSGVIIEGKPYVPAPPSQPR